MIMTRPPWTSDPTDGGVREGYKGRWAGDRFDINTLDQVSSEHG